MPCSHGCPAVRAFRSLAPPTSAAISISKDLCWGEETRRLYFLRSWKFCFAVVAPRRTLRRRRVYWDRLDFSFFLSEVRFSDLQMLRFLPPTPLYCGPPSACSIPSVLPYSVAAFPCPSLFEGRLHAPSRGIAPSLAPDRWMSR